MSLNKPVKKHANKKNVIGNEPIGFGKRTTFSVHILLNTNLKNAILVQLSEKYESYLLILMEKSPHLIKVRNCHKITNISNKMIDDKMTHK